MGEPYAGCFFTSQAEVRSFSPGTKAGLAVFTSNRHKQAYLLALEVKPPNYHSNNLWSSDTVKLGNELKDIIDKVIDDGVGEDIVVCGLLVEGFRCDLFVMDLKYNAVYRMIRLGRCYLPRDRHDFAILYPTIELLLQAKSIVIRSARLCVTSFRNTLKLSGTQTPPPKNKMTRPSFHTPLKIPRSSSTNK